MLRFLLQLRQFSETISHTIFESGYPLELYMPELLREKSSVTVQSEEHKIGLRVLVSLMHSIHLVDHQLRVTHHDQTAVHWATPQGSLQAMD